MRADYIFVGERRSNRAMTMGVTWLDGRLAAKTLFAALAAIGLDPACQRYVNVYQDDGTLNVETLSVIRAAPDSQIIAMGEKAQRELAKAGIAFRALIHPAARGAIRKTHRYQAHVAAVLGLDGDA